MMKINAVRARQILDSRGIPTVEAEVWLDSGEFGRAAVPSGASTGEHEAHELRDGGEAFGGQGVMRAVANAKGEIQDRLKGMMADDQFLIDQAMIDLDGTASKSRLGANAVLAVSLAAAHAAAKARGLLLYTHVNDIAGNPPKSMPMPMMNFFNGGKHANNSSDIQEYMVVPTAAKSYAEAVKIGAEIFQSIKQAIAKSGHSTSVGDEGGFAGPVRSNHEILDLLSISARQAGYEPGRDVDFALDIAASELFENGAYKLNRDQKNLNGLEMIRYLEELSKNYPLISIEDGLAQDEWDDWELLTNELGHLQLVADDLTVTNSQRLKRAIDANAGNAILIKPNQIGTLTETIHAIQLAQNNNWRTIVSHRSGETEDVTIAHLAVGTGAGQIKTGSLSRGERTAKHNELMRLEELDTSLKLTPASRS